MGVPPSYRIDSRIVNPEGDGVNPNAGYPHIIADGKEPYEQVTIFLPDHPDAVPQPMGEYPLT
jgi:hypothetical protein